MSIFKKAIASAVGAIASYYAVKYVTAFLEERPLMDRVDDIKTFAVDLKDSAECSLADAKDDVTTKIEKISDKVNSLFQSKK